MLTRAISAVCLLGVQRITKLEGSDRVTVFEARIGSFSDQQQKKITGLQTATKWSHFATKI